MAKSRGQPARFPLGTAATMIAVMIVAGSIGFFAVFQTASRAVMPSDLVGRVSSTTPALIDIPDSIQPVHLIAVGDIMLSRTVADKINSHHDVDYPFLKIEDRLRSADVAFANLENPITTGPPVATDELKLHANPGVEIGLRNAGVDVVSVANNHIPDFGATGILDTVRLLDAVGIKHAGAGRNLNEALTPAIIESNGLRLAFLAFNDTDVVQDSYGASENHAGTALFDIPRLASAVQSAKQSADLVIVSIHAGVEYAAQANASQKSFAHAAVDVGADLVIGSHPHVVQPMEQYHGKYIFYSLGNFVFDQTQPMETRLGMAVELTLSKSGVVAISYLPVQIDDYSQPRFVEGAEAERILARLHLP